MGDIDGNGYVDGVDAGLVERNNGKYGDISVGDVNGDGSVDGVDYGAVERNQGKESIVVKYE